ncbi:DNA polymerase III, delta' subunit [Neisseria sp. oral taxon 020 str. F0370]|uniref:DNA polymerase III subunit delta' n=1 Tax=unclassified Neisseria TaxID=2623750 RepID=UPI0002A2FB41|nr:MULTISPECIES: DNA polymerase III subunit delta' [unclassified Neisseria]ASP18407.1 DNA polymerase III subunit delta' [Neisseria sp. KEM232]EKY06866.1 DNA polymerase III, delta' subunit [Neisseria sp. oral taxon 020 str. F0370]
MIYPWHESDWRSLAEHRQQLPHALLFSGKENTGKTAFARHLAQSLLCENSGAAYEACGQCPSCHLFAQNSHPDFYELTPEIPEGEAVGRKLLQIKIDAVRDVIEHVRLTSVRGGRRVVLVHPAESMNAQSANALLKILEEPPEGVVFLLVSHERDRLLPTVKSRCRQIILHSPERAAALAYVRERHPQHAEELLAFHSGAPLFDDDAEQTALRGELLQLLSAPRLIAALDYAAAFDKHKLPLAVFLDWLQKWLLDVGLAQQNMPPLYYPAFAAQSAAIAARTAPHALFALTGRLNSLVPYGRHTLSVKMQLEFLLTEYLHFWQNK